MQVDEVLTFEDYWRDTWFLRKRPSMRGSIRQAFGNNIYYKDTNQQWQQMDSHHSLDNGTPNAANVFRDSSTDRVLVSQHFVYWGGTGPELPLFDGCDICAATLGHISNFLGDVVDSFVEWLNDLPEKGYLADPHDWKNL